MAGFGVDGLLQRKGKPLTKFMHYERNSMPVCLELTDRPVVDRITPKHPRTKYKGEGICLGAWVTGRGKTLPWHSTIPGITGQIWAQATGKGNWWVVTEQGHAYIMHEYSMTLLGQASEDVPLFEEDAS